MFKHDTSESQNMVIVSDELTHTKIILATSQPPHINISTSSVTASPTSQFKQRFLFSNLYAWVMEHDLNITWIFFATSHGKGAVDGIWGTLKRANVKAAYWQMPMSSIVGKQLVNVHIPKEGIAHFLGCKMGKHHSYT